MSASRPSSGGIGPARIKIRDDKSYELNVMPLNEESGEMPPMYIVFQT